MTDADGEPRVQALLLHSFGGPEHPDDVRPFLENVTRGRNVPPERLDAVAEHYLHFGGVSPINGLNRQLADDIRARLNASGIDLPVYFGNRNWHPMIEDTVREMADDGVERALVLATSAWGGYSGCRQYQEDIRRARDTVGRGAPELVRLRQFHDQPLFIDAFADAVRSSRGHLAATSKNPRLVFTAHSVPVSADASAGPPDAGGHLYSRQVAESARLVADAVGIEDYDLVWQSRSGPPRIPWLEPDICDHLDSVVAHGHDGVLICPVGFVSDHLEVVWDLDTEAGDRAAELGIGFARAATPGTDARFVSMIVELIREHIDTRAAFGAAIGADEANSAEKIAPVRRLGEVPQYGCTVNGALCAVDCCAPAGRP